jgi:ABC-type xylose transport system permease subunit
MRKIVLTFGLIAAGILSVMMLITMLWSKIDFDNGEVIGYTTMVVAFLMIYFGIRSYRDNVAGGSLRFGRAFKVGFLIMLIGVAGYVATWEVIYYKFAPDFADKYAAHAVAKAKSSGKSDAEVAELSKQMAAFQESYQNPLVNVAYTTLEPLPVGLVLTLVSAFALSRKRRESGVPAE